MSLGVSAPAKKAPPSRKAGAKPKAKPEPKAKKSTAKAVTWETVRQLALALPGAEEGTSYGTPAFRVHGGKLFARLKEDGETIVVFIDMIEREILMGAKPETFFITDHYRNWPAMLVRLATVEVAELSDLLEESWRRGAPKRLLAQRP